MEDSDFFEPCGNHEFAMKVKWTDLSWSWQQFYHFCRNDNKIVWTADDCCVVTARDAPGKHPYNMDVIFGQGGDSKKVSVTAVDCEAAASTVAGLMSLVTATAGNEEDDLESDEGSTTLIFKCFATQPRQPFPPLLPQEDSTSEEQNAKIHDLQIHFCNIDENTCRVLAAASCRLELRQCQVEGLQVVLSSASSCPEKLVVSCTMPEFAKFAGGFSGGHGGRLLELELLLHFWLQGDAFDAFCSSLSTNHGLEHLTISYLDIDDKGWSLLFQSLAKHSSLKRLVLQFTDNFVDNYRRLTPERRTARTRAVLDMLQDNLTIQEIKWPEFQQDEELMAHVMYRLANNKAEASTV